MQGNGIGWFGGVDFSGAQGRAGEQARVVALLAATEDGRLRLDELRAGWTLPDLGAHILGRPGSWWGCDFPFGLPQPMMTALGDEHPPTFERALTWIAGCGNPDSFRAEANRLVGEVQPGRKEVRRRTDTETRTPFCVNNARLYRQTFHGMAGLLLPLRAGGATILPWDSPRWDGAAVVVLEACPASSLKRLGHYFPYKGREAALGEARARLLAWLGTLAPLDISDQDAQRIVADPGGDLLDALICALAARSAAMLPAEAHTRLQASYGDSEGVVFDGLMG